MNKRLHAYSFLLAAAFTFGTPAVCALLASTCGDICWPQRIGALLVGIAVFLQGYIAADADRFNRVMSDGNSLRTYVNQGSYFAAVFGTLFAAFGDLLPVSVYYGVQMCGA